MKAKATQCEKILSYLRAHRKATNMTLTVDLRIGCPHKRLRDLTDPQGMVYQRGPFDGLWRATGERITRERVKTTGGAYVTMYRLEAKR